MNSIPSSQEPPCHPAPSASSVQHAPRLLLPYLPSASWQEGHSQWPVSPRLLSTAQCGLTLPSCCRKLLPLPLPTDYSIKKIVPLVWNPPFQHPRLSSCHLLHLRRRPEPCFSSCSTSIWTLSPSLPNCSGTRLYRWSSPLFLPPWVPSLADQDWLPGMQPVQSHMALHLKSPSLVSCSAVAVLQFSTIEQEAPNFHWALGCTRCIVGPDESTQVFPVLKATSLWSLPPTGLSLLHFLTSFWKYSCIHFSASSSPLCFTSTAPGGQPFLMFWDHQCYPNSLIHGIPQPCHSLSWQHLSP